MSVRRKAINQIKKEINYHKNQINAWELTWIYTGSNEEVEKAKKRIEDSKEAIKILEYILMCILTYKDFEEKNFE